MRYIITAIILFLLLTVAVGAEDADLYGADEFNAGAIIDSLPEDVRSDLPSGDLYTAEGALDGFTAEYFFALIGKAISAAVSPMLRTLASLIGILLVSSVVAKAKEMFSSEAIGAVFDTVSGICIFLSVNESVWKLADGLKEYLSRLSVLVNACVPVTAAISIAGGGVNRAAVSTNGMMLGLAIVETLASQGLFPIIKLCMGLCAASGIGGGLKIGSIAGTVRGAVLFMFSLMGAILSAVTTFQSSIAARADSLSMRAVKFAASHSVPDVGGVAGDAVGAVAESLSLVKGTVGWVGVALIIVITLPMAANILLTRLGFAVAELAADILGLDREYKTVVVGVGNLGQAITNYTYYYKIGFNIIGLFFKCF